MTDPAASPLSALEAVAACWTHVDLSAERHIALDQKGLEIADNQELSAEGREKLKEVIRQFRGVPAEERPAQIGSVIRAFQAEIDALTQRQSSAEAAFLSLYRSLDDAPDPLPAIHAAAAELRRLAAEAADAQGLRTKLSDYDREFTSLKNQDATIRRLERQLKEVDSKSESLEAVEAALASREAQWQEEAHAVAEQTRQREEAQAARLSRAQEEAREATRAHQQAQETLFEMRSGFEQAQEAAASEMEMLRAELERATATQVASEKHAAALGKQLQEQEASTSGAAAAAAAEQAAAAAEQAAEAEARLEQRLSQKELQLAQTSAQLSSAERQLSALEEKAKAEKSALEARLAELGVALAAAHAAAQQQPSGAEHANLLAEVDALRGQLSLGVDAGLGDGGQLSAELLAAAGITERDESGRSMSALLVANAQRMQSELALSRAQLADLEEEVKAARLAASKTDEQLSTQAATIVALEDRWLQLQQLQQQQQHQATPGETTAPSGAARSLLSTPTATAGGAAEALSAVLTFGASSTIPATPATPGGAAAASGSASASGGGGLEPLASSSADDAFKLVCGQRERARRQVEELEAETHKLKEQLQSHQAESRRLNADNLKLYEKVKFLQSTAAAGHSAGSALAPTPIGQNSIEEQATEGRYQKLYEEKVNPFAAFHRRERQQRYAELPAPEKLILNFSSFFLANRHARLFLFGYMICLHLLVSGAMYAASHHC